MLASGSNAPAFELPGDDGESHSLQALLGNGPLVLYFYPADFTPGCTREACSLRDMHTELVDAGLQVVGVSPQDVDSHVRFKAEYSLPFRLLSDVDKSVIKTYDADGPLGIGVRRITYLIETDGTIRDGVQADLRVARHTEFVRKAASLAASD
ncbi:MAG: peroxiredoxin [Woeseiaceae bacterium]|nr:peroxiredoxin [Woeseiaceae bacterium]